MTGLLALLVSAFAGPALTAGIKGLVGLTGQKLPGPLVPIAHGLIQYGGALAVAKLGIPLDPTLVALGGTALGTTVRELAVRIDALVADDPSVEPLRPR